MNKTLLSTVIALIVAGTATAQTVVPPPVRKSSTATDPDRAAKDQPPQSQPRPVSAQRPAQTELVPNLTEINKEEFDAIKKGEGKTGKSSSTVVVTGPGGKSSDTHGLAPDEQVVDFSQLPGGLDSTDVRMKQQKARAELEAILKAKQHSQRTPGSADDKAAPPRASTATNTLRTEVIETTVWPNGVVPGSNVTPPDGTTGKRLTYGATPDNTKPIVIDAIQGVNELVTIAKGELNRFVTPFERVKVKTAAGEDELVSKVDGNIVYIGVTKRAGVFLTEVGTDRAISLTLDPADIPPRDIYVKLRRGEGIPASLSKLTKGGGGKTGGSPEFGPQEKSQSHVDGVKDVMRDLALGKLPNGYSLMPFKAGEAYCSIPGFRVRLGQMIEGGNYKIAVFRAENNTGATQQIDEQFCYKRGVVAVAAWPEVNVAPRGITELFVMTRVQDPEPASSLRPSLLWTDPAKAKSLQAGDDE